MTSAHERDVRRIIVIDDNRAIHDDFRKILVDDRRDQAVDALEASLFGDPQPGADRRAYEVDFADQGAIGFEKVSDAARRGDPFELAFVDMRMPPGWDGVETIEHLWQVDPDLQVVICTAYSDLSWADITARLGSSDRLLILKKPFDTAEVCQMALALTEKWRLGRAARMRLDELERLVEKRTAALQTQIESRERMGEVLREREALMTAIVNTAADGIITFDEQGLIASANVTAGRLFGRPPEEIVGQGVTRLIGGDLTDDERLRLVAPSPSHQEGRACRELRALRQGGGEFPSQWMISAFSSAGVQRYTAIIRDLTEHKQMQVELAHAQKLESVGQLAAGIAHEINTPAQYVGDNLEFVRDAFRELQPVWTALDSLMAPGGGTGPLDARAREAAAAAQAADWTYLIGEVPRAVDEAIEGVTRISTIVRAMKEFSHPGTDAKTLVDLPAAIETTVTVSRNEWKYVADVETSFDPNLPPVLGLPGELNQVFLNLIVNAAHAIGDVVAAAPGIKGKITISARERFDHVEVAISDTGGGIPETIRNKIFDPFFTTKEVGKGTGQGLAIARSVVVDKHGGEIDFESAVGEGTTFYIRLPLQNSAAPEESCAATSAP